MGVKLLIASTIVRRNRMVKGCTFDTNTMECVGISISFIFGKYAMYSNIREKGVLKDKFCLFTECVQTHTSLYYIQYLWVSWELFLPDYCLSHPLLLLLYLLWIIYNNMYSAREGLISRLDKTVVVLATDSITSNNIFILKALYDIRSSTCDVSLLLLRPFANFWHPSKFF